MTVAYHIVGSCTGGDEWFGRVGTTTPPVMRGTRKFITCVVMAGGVTTGTLSTVTPADAVALSAIMAQPGTLPAIPVQPAPPVDHAVPGILQRLRRLSGLARRARSPSSRSLATYHPQLAAGVRVAADLARLLELSSGLIITATGSVEGRLAYRPDAAERQWTIDPR